MSLGVVPKNIAWVYSDLYPWWPVEDPAGGEDVGTATAYPVETGWVGTHDLYWAHRRLIGLLQIDSTPFGTQGSGIYVGTDRGTSARALIRPTESEIPIAHKGDPEGFTGVFSEFTIYPDSLIYPDTNQHYLHQVFSGVLLDYSGSDGFSTDQSGNHVGYVTIVANEGNQSVYRYPIYTHGPNELIRELNLIITRRLWLREEL